MATTTAQCADIHTEVAKGTEFSAIPEHTTQPVSPSSSSQPTANVEITSSPPLSPSSRSSFSRSPTSPKHIISDLYHSPKLRLANLRHPWQGQGSKQKPVSTENPTTVVSVVTLPVGTLSVPKSIHSDYPDLVSKDKARQKEAVKQYLAEKVRNDWEFPWLATAAKDSKSPVGGAADTDRCLRNGNENSLGNAEQESGYEVDSDDSETASTYTTVSEDETRARPRVEWISDLSDSDDELVSPPRLFSSPFRFDNPDEIGETVRAAALAKRAKRRRSIRKEMEWNSGLACFEARRNAWTGARTVKLRSKLVSTTSAKGRPSLSPRRLLFRSPSTSSPPNTGAEPLAGGPACSSEGTDSPKDLSPTTTAASPLGRAPTKSSTSPARQSSVPSLPVETMIPVPQPLLPPENLMRASVTPTVYLSIYDKVILQSISPSCPLNLLDMIRSCVEGWKRDGEWPPRQTGPDAAAAAAAAAQQTRKNMRSAPGVATAGRRLSFVGVFGKGDRGESGKRKGWQRMFGGGQSKPHLLNDKS